MPSSKSKSASPISGYIRANLEANGFVCLLFTLVMTAIAFLSARNSYYGTGEEDMTLLDPSALNIGRLLFIAGFAFAAYQFRPFLIKIERDVILALPIKQTHLVLSGITTGLITILISGILSLLVFYPAMNMALLESGEVYGDLVISAFCNIIIPLCAFFLLSGVLILKTRDFLTSGLWSIAIALCCYSVAVWLKTNSALEILGVSQGELFGETQPFYHDGSFYLPTYFVACLLRSFLPLGASFVSSTTLFTIINIVLCVGFFYILYKSAGKTYLGEMDRPFKLKALKYALPIAVIAVLCCSYATKDSSVAPILVSFLCAGVSVVVIAIFTKDKKVFIKRAIACLFVVLMPLLSIVSAPLLANNTTCEVPGSFMVEAVYFNAVEPKEASEFGMASQLRAADLAVETAKTRYRFTSKEAIEAIIELHKTIAMNIDEMELVGNKEGVKAERVAVSSTDKLKFGYDEYLDDYGHTVDLDLGYSVDMTPKNNLPLNVDSQIIEKDNAYIATFYYVLKDGRVFKRVFTPLPLEWIEEPMKKVLSTKEYVDKQMKYLLENNSVSPSGEVYLYDGQAKDFYNGEEIERAEDEIFDLCRAIIEDEARLSDNDILKSEIVYTVSFEGSELINQYSDYLYIRKDYKNTLSLLNKWKEGGDK